MNRQGKSSAPSLRGPAPLNTVTHMGLDVHKNFSRLTARNAQGQVVTRRRLDHADRGALRQEFQQFPPGTPIVLEGSFGWGWMSDELAAAGLDPHLANCRKVEGWRQARGGAKTNRCDADLLSELWPQQPRWWEVYLAPQDVRDQREILRHRMGLVQVQTALKNRIHAVLHRHGLIQEHADLFGKAGWRFLESLLAPADGRLRASAQSVLAADLKLLQQLRGPIAQVTRQILRHVRLSPEARRWKSLPGVGMILAYTLHAEIGPLARFPRGRSLAKYSLLVPLPDDSGDEDPTAIPRGRHLGQAGRRTLKWAFLEAARSAVQKSPRLRAVFDRHTAGGTRDRNRGYVAVAHQLVLIGHACQKHGQDYTETPPPRPGTRPGPDAASSKVQGQPDPAMAQGPA